jgi:sugar lactone lactonase YvrE
MRPRSGRLLGFALAPVLALTTLVPASSESFPERIELPDGFMPEGIAIGSGPTAWFGSRADGDIYEVDLRTGAGEVISQGPGTPSVGMKVDNGGRLFVAGGPTGTARVVDTETGDLIASYRLTTATSTFVNDVLITPSAVWFTDSRQPQLYAVLRSPDGTLADEHITVPLSGAWVQGAGNNANGLTLTPDGSALLVVNSSDGALHRVDPRSGVATVVDLGGYLLTNGDGMLLRGRTLYVVQNRLNKVAVIQLDKAGTTGELVDTITSPGFDVPATVAAFGDSLCLPNARFTTMPQTPETEFWVTCVRR